MEPDFDPTDGYGMVYDPILKKWRVLTEKDLSDNNNLAGHSLKDFRLDRYLDWVLGKEEDELYESTFDDYIKYTRGLRRKPKLKKGGKEKTEDTKIDEDLMLKINKTIETKIKTAGDLWRVGLFTIKGNGKK